MSRRSVHVPIFAALLALSVASFPRILAAFSTSGCEVVPSAVDEALVFQAIREPVTGLEAALHRKVASVLTTKIADNIAGTSYESAWQVTVKYWLDYSRPDDVPYLQGMRKCLAECAPTAGKEWVAWAETQIASARDGFAEEIAFQQESQMKVLVTASLDATGKLIASTVKVFHVVSESEALSITAETLAAPSDKQMEQAGYYFLKDQINAKTPTSSGAAPPAQSESQPSGGSGTTAPGQSSPQSQKPTTQGSAWGSADPDRRILLIGVSVLIGLILLLALNQYLLRRRR